MYSVTIFHCNNIENIGFIVNDQINNVYKSTNYQLYKIRSKKELLTLRISKKLIESLVVTCIHYLHISYT